MFKENKEGKERRGKAKIINGNEIPEDTMIEAIKYGFKECQKIISFQWFL